MIKKTTILLTLAFAFLFSASLTFATTTATTTPPGKVKAQEKLEKRCTQIENKIQVQIGRYEDGKARHLNSYSNLANRLEKLITRLEDKGYDTTQLKTDLVTLKTKIAKFSTDYLVYITRLNGTKAYACGKSEGEFKNELKSAKDLLKAVQDDSEEIRSFYQETIKPDLKALRKQNVNTNTNSSTSTDSENDD